jgi:predicted DNA-binding protein (MmcQ/YjbR family)
MMDIDWLRKTCIRFPNSTEQIQWGYDLVFKVGGKMFAIAPLEPARVCLTFKCSDESFAELTERPNIIPAPYLARAKWAALESSDAVGRAELAELLRASYHLVVAKLPKNMQEKLNAKSSSGRKPGKIPSGKRKSHPARKKMKQRKTKR